MRNFTRFWLIPYVIHASDQPYWKMHASEWSIEQKDDLSNLEAGDVVYLANQESGIYAWGRVLAKGEGQLRIGKGAIGNSLVDAETINRRQELNGLLDFRNGQLNFLSGRQVRVINSVINAKSKPPDAGMRFFVKGEQVQLDEDLFVEYKNVKTSQISKEAYECALSFLEQSGGAVFFGIDDSSLKVLGLELKSKERDEVKRKLESRLFSIVPPIYPDSDYSIEFHPVHNEAGQQIPDLYVLELEIKPQSVRGFRSSGGKRYLKTFSGRKKIADGS